jgi:hypothetical protein
MHPNRGFLFPILMIFLFIFSLMLMTVSEQIIVQTKLLNQQKNYQEINRIARSFLFKQASKIIHDKVSLDNFSRGDIDSLSWWRKFGHLQQTEKYSIYTVTQHLATIPCAVLENQQVAGVEFFTITLLIFTKDLAQKLTFEAVYSRLSNHCAECPTQLLAIIPNGIQSLRKIPD